MDADSINATSEMSASGRARSHRQALDNPRAVSYDAGGNDVTGDVRPVAAYESIDPRGPSEPLSGRGLY
jgi:rare lipoprotein A